jgi:4,5:9,10-diseco-3-hydroxy-5,9,17-trioxoandrosta-1(10),2-diene-4-oate hydrolase
VSWKRYSLGVLAVGAAAGVLAALRYGNRFIDQFEDTAHDDLAHGEFVQTSAGWRIHYTVQGEGSPIILIHGFLDSLQTWQHNVEILAQNHRVYALDVLGFGCSDRVRDPIYTLKQQAAVLFEFFESQNIQKADIVGHSMGGALALQFAYDFPASVHKLVLIAPATFLYNRFPRNGLKTIPRPVTRGVLGIYERIQADRSNPLQFAYGDPERITQDQIRIRNQMMRVRGQHDALISMSKSKREANVPQELDRVAVPTLIIWGRKDRVVPAAHANRHAKAMPNARLEWVETAGHLPHEEESDTVNQLMTSFLDDEITRN